GPPDAGGRHAGQPRVPVPMRLVHPRWVANKQTPATPACPSATLPTESCPTLHATTMAASAPTNHSPSPPSSTPRSIDIAASLARGARMNRRRQLEGPYLTYRPGTANSLVASQEPFGAGSKHRGHGPNRRGAVRGEAVRSDRPARRPALRERWERGGSSTSLGETGVHDHGAARAG